MARGDVNAVDRPLFDSHSTLELTLEAPIRTLIRSAERRPELAGKLYYSDAQGGESVIGIELATRGHSRLEMCSFPPLSIRFDPGQTAGTVFAGQNKLKIVTQCERGYKFRDYLLEEYGIYRAFGVLTERAFRVRMLEITFRDSEGKRSDSAQNAFFIESVDEVAERLGLFEIEELKVRSDQLEPTHANLSAVFHFMIGNTDWSVGSSEKGEPCCHNGKVIGKAGSDRGWSILPYDFDQAGLINTSYALPHERLPIRTVRQRLFRGRCAYMQHLDDTIEVFNRRRGDIEAALASGGPTDRTRKGQLKYIADFFEIINDPEQLQNELIDRCVGMRGD